VLLNGTEVDAAPLRERLGLAADAEDAAIYEALGIPEPSSDAAAVVEETQVAAAAAPAAPAVPEGMALIDQDTLAELQAGVQVAREVAAGNARAARDQMVQQAIAQGRITAGSRARWTERYDRDPEGTTTLLTASAAEGGLAPGLIPVNRQEIGRAGDGEADPSVAEAGHDQFMARYFPTSGRRSRIHQEA
jgi:hypothetical protein